MKLYVLDYTHNHIINEGLDLGHLNKNEIDLVRQILTFLDNAGLSNRYHTLCLASHVEMFYDEEGDPELKVTP